MTSNQTKRVSIDRERLNHLIKTGHGKEIPLDKLGKKSRRTKWTLKELEEKTGLNYQRISKICRGTGGKEQNYSTVALLAAALDVDVEYLTGDQELPHTTPQRQQQDQELRENERRLKDTIQFIKRYGIVVKVDSRTCPAKYRIYDAGDNLIREYESMDELQKDLLPLVQMIHNLFSTGRDLVSLFFDGAELWEEQ